LTLISIMYVETLSSIYIYTYIVHIVGHQNHLWKRFFYWKAKAQSPDCRFY